MKKQVTLITKRDGYGIVKSSQIIIPKKAEIFIEEIEVTQNIDGTKTIELQFTLPNHKFDHLMYQDILPRDEVYQIMNDCDDEQERKILEYAKSIKRG